MDFAKIICIFVLSCAVLGAEQPKKEKLEPPKPPTAEEDAVENAEWLQAIERLRSLPKPGEVKNATFRAQLSDIYALNDEQKKKFAEIRAAFDAELLKRAAKWDEEEKALRDEYESKLILLVPDERREAAKKLLDFSHKSWVSPLDREEKFKKEYADRVFKLQQARAKLSVEELNDARDEMRAWVKESRAKIMKQDEETLGKIRELLSPEEQARLTTNKK